jgi:biuret amidohydrolase
VTDFFTLSRTFIPPVELDPGRLAVVVVDMQYNDASPDHGFGLAMSRIEPGSMDYFNRRNEGLVVPGIRRLLDGCRAQDVPVVFVCVGSPYRDLRDLPARHRAWIRDIEGRSGVDDILWDQNPAYAIRRELGPEEDDTIVRKSAFGAFTSSTIDATLRGMGREQLIVVGIATNCCVSTTIRDAADLGYGVVVVDECTADYDEVTHETAMKGLYFNFARVVPTVDEMLAAIAAREAV